MKGLSYVLLAIPFCVMAQTAFVVNSDRLQLANQLSKHGMTVEALAEYEAIRNDPSLPSDEILFRIAECNRVLKRDDKAVESYSKLLAEKPESKFADYARLNRALMTKGRERQRDFAALDRDDVPKAVRQTALYYLAEDVALVSPSKAAVIFRKTIAQNATVSLTRISKLRLAAVLSSSEDQVERREALMMYLDMAHSKDDPALAEEALYFAAMLDFKDGKYNEAYSLFKNLRSTYPNGARAAEASIFAAWASFRSGKFAEALSLASPLREGGNEDAYYLTAASLRKLERRSDAISAYDAALKAHPFGRYANAEWFERLALKSASGDAKGVLADLAARGDWPEDTADRALTYGIDAAVKAKNDDQALIYARRVAAMLKSPYAPRALYMTGVLEARMGDLEGARRDWTAFMIRWPDSPLAEEVLVARALEEVRAQDWKRAVGTYEELARRFEKRSATAEVLYWHGVALVGDNRPDDAEKFFAKALSANPAESFVPEIEFEMASLYRRKGRNAEAAALYAKILGTKTAERLAPARLAWIGETMVAVSNYPAAKIAAESLKLRDADPTWNQIALVLEGDARFGLGERDAAVARYRSALEIPVRTVTAAKAALSLGRMETLAGRYDEARGLLADAIDRTRSDELQAMRAQAYAALADNEDAAGEKEEALRCYLLVTTLFDDEEFVPRAFEKAISLAKALGKNDMAKKLEAEFAERR